MKRLFDRQSSLNSFGYGSTCAMGSAHPTFLKVKDIRPSSNLIAPLVADDSSPFSFTETIPRIVSETGNKFTILSNTIAKPVSFSVEKATQVSSSEVDTSEVTLKKLGTFDSNSLQVAIKEHHANHVTVNEFSISQIARVEPTTSKITVSPFNISEVDITPFGAIGNSKTSRLKLDSIQNSSTQIDVSPFESGKVSLPSVISSQKLVSSNLSHDNTYELNNIYSTAQTLWHTTTPIDLNFAITNLPTGQLVRSRSRVGNAHQHHFRFSKINIWAVNIDWRRDCSIA